MAAETAAPLIKKVSTCGDDFYKILGVEKDAGDDTIKKAYRKLALRLHPDKCKESGAEEAFKKVGEAFSILSDAQKRQQYDQYGVQGIREGGGRGDPRSPQDIFEAFFNAGGMHAGPTVFRTSTMGGGGFQTFTFSSGGGPNVFHFSSGHPSGPRMRRREQEPEPEREEPEFLKMLGPFGQVLLGPLLPIIILLVMVLGFFVVSVAMQFIVSKCFFILPILYFPLGRMRWPLLVAVIVFSVLGWI